MEIWRSLNWKIKVLHIKKWCRLLLLDRMEELIRAWPHAINNHKSSKVYETAVFRQWMIVWGNDLKTKEMCKATFMFASLFWTGHFLVCGVGRWAHVQSSSIAGWKRQRAEVELLRWLQFVDQYTPDGWAVKKGVSKVWGKVIFKSMAKCLAAHTPSKTMWGPPTSSDWKLNTNAGAGRLWNFNPFTLERSYRVPWAMALDYRQNQNRIKVNHCNPQTARTKLNTL